VANANNAAFGAQAAYDDWVPGFEALFAQQAAPADTQPAQQWQRFYDAVKRLADMPPASRLAALKSR
jgi:predicted aminopeptidase